MSPGDDTRPLSTLEPTGERGGLDAATEAMSDDQARAVARQIFELDAHYRPPFT